MSRARPWQALPAEAKSVPASRGDVGKQLILDCRDAVLQGQLALLQALDVQLVRQGERFLRRNLGVKIAVLGPQPRQFFAELALVASLHRPYGPSPTGKPPARI